MDMESDTDKGGTHRTLGVVKEANVALDDGGPERARVVLVPEDGGTVSFLMDQDEAHDFALSLSKNVVDRREVQSDS